jgi:Bacterial protein of unknown function (DUF885)
MSRLPARIALASCVLAIAACTPAPPQPSAASKSTRYDDLQKLFADWRAFQPPRMVDGAPDYTADAMAAQHRELATYQQRLASIDPGGWPVPQQVDYHIVRAEMNGLDFDLRVLRPWVRDPSYYKVVHTAQSDTPAHEGSAVHGAIELWTYTFPIPADRLQAFRTTMKAAPALFDQARKNLTGDSRDLWRAGIDTAKEQSAALAALATRLGTIQPDLVSEVKEAARAADDFRAWLEAELPRKTGPSGVGVDNYNWYLKNVHLLPHTWQDQVTMVRRELVRGLAALKLEEHRNRALPPQAPVASADEHTRRFNDAVTEYMAFFQNNQILTVEPWMDQALRERIGTFRAGPREFFSEVDYRDPVVMRTHSFHWIDLARMARAPHANPIRRGPLLYNIWAQRSEGLATGMEEMMMHAGVFDTHPRTRELIHVLLAQRGARAMGDLMMHANQWTLEQAGTFAVEWTPRGWLREDGATVWGEQQLYLQQPAYGTSYLIGKIQIEQLIADRAKQQGDGFTLRQFMDDFQAAGLIPVTLIRWEMTGRDDEIAAVVK